jgi:hypothetical protein
VPPISSQTGLPSILPRRSQSAVSSPPSAREIGAWKLVLLFRDEIDQVIDVEGRLAKCVGRHLPVQHLCRDVGKIWRDLAPADLAAVGRDFDETDELIGEGFNVD